MRGEEKKLLLLNGADGLDGNDLLSLDLGSSRGADTGSSLELGSNGLSNLNLTSNINLDQQQVDRELLDLQINSGLDLGRERSLDLGLDLGRGLDGQLGSLGDNLLGLKVDASGVMGGADLGDDVSNVNLEVGSELGLDLSINLGLDSSLDGGLKSAGQLGTQTEVSVDQSAMRDK